MMRKKFCILPFIFLSISINFYSCSDKCKKIFCYNGGICIDGICGCQSGYEGDDCIIKTLTKFLGAYNVSDNCSVTGNAIYTVNVWAVDSNNTEVFIANFNNDFSNSVQANIGIATIEIPPQFPDADGRSVTGNGTFNGTSTITWNYTIISPGGQINSCTNSIWTK
ncbi:MAG: hypothetical protein H0V61_04620 [Chitinophagales bacterium]|nr:hypothetical protein [Chitinophagales bacterium]